MTARRGATARTLPYVDRFGLTDAAIRRLLALALASGGDFAEVFCEYRASSFILMEDDIIKETAETISLGLGVRVLRGVTTGYGYANDLSRPSLDAAARTAAAIASGRGRRVRPAPSRPGPRPLRLFPVRLPASKAGLSEKIALVRDAYEAALACDPAVVKVRVGLGDSLQTVRIVNSAGVEARDVRPLIKMTCSAIAERGDRRESGYHGGGGRVGMEYFAEELPPRAIGRAAAAEAVRLLDARPAPAGEMPVVLAPGHAGVLIHEAVGHLLEADFHRRRTSVLWNKIGAKVGADAVTIIDDPTLPRFRGSYDVDDEGTLPRPTVLVENGRAVGRLQDILSARYFKTSPTGHGRREDYSCWPLPRMSNIYIAAGVRSPEEIIGSVDKGLYAEAFQGGEVEDSGKFTFSVSSGYLIEGGRLTAPVRQATLIGTNIDILNKIALVGNDLRFGLPTGTCSKEGQDVPVTDGCPTLKIAEMTVGGRA
ncbi:MAG: TldD/PmbA family protein [Candidatus Aminicenantes bacterium]|nr:TldD/PmbA family protein [Candidatus Aminicenantes bacterium]